MICNGNRLQNHSNIINVGANHSIALGKFTGGKLWVEDSSGRDSREVRPGKTVPGRLIPHRRKMVCFDPRLCHGVEPWSGTRWSITAFQTRSSVDLNSTRVQEFKDFGFELNDQSGVSVFESVSTQALLDTYMVWSTGGGNSKTSYPVTNEDDNLEEPTDEPENAEPMAEEGRETLSESQKNLVKKIHVNTGHPPRDRLLRTLKAAGAKTCVLRYVRDEFRCQACDT